MAGPEGLQPTPPPDTAPQTYRFGIEATSADLHTAAGDVAVRIEINPIACTIFTRRNESWTGPIALVRVIPLKAAVPAFPDRMFTAPTMFPSISIDEVDVPNGWRWTVNYWVEDEPKLKIRQSSRSIRNIAFLGDDDEIVLAAPQGGWRTGWNDLDMKPIEAPIIATVQWRVRPDGTRG